VEVSCSMPNTAVVEAVDRREALTLLVRLVLRDAILGAIEASVATTRPVWKSGGAIANSALPGLASSSSSRS
jgi:hypothetical protein